MSYVKDTSPIEFKSIGQTSRKMPNHIWANRFNCVDYNNCVAQMGSPLGCTPLTPLTFYTGPPVQWQNIPDVLQAHKIITPSSVPNFLSARIPIQRQLHTDNWEKYLIDYWDKQLVDLLRFGFPSDFDRNLQLQTTPTITSQLRRFLNTSRLFGYRGFFWCLIRSIYQSTRMEER